jgi:hypothetical protein
MKAFSQKIFHSSETQLTSSKPPTHPPTQQSSAESAACTGWIHL